MEDPKAQAGQTPAKADDKSPAKAIADVKVEQKRDWRSIITKRDWAPIIGIIAMILAVLILCASVIFALSLFNWPALLTAPASKSAAPGPVQAAVPPTPTTVYGSGEAPIDLAGLAGASLPRKGELFQTPVKCQKGFNKQSSWLVCEPGVLLDNATAWVIPATKAPYYFNVPEGGFWYGSLGSGLLTVDGVSIVLKPEKGLNYLVLIRGRIDDNIVDSDLNITGQLENFVAGHAIYSHMPKGAYVSHDWFRQQLVASSTESFTNCGGEGCSRVRIVLFDVDSHYFQEYETHAGALDTWQLIQQN